MKTFEITEIIGNDWHCDREVKADYFQIFETGNLHFIKRMNDTLELVAAFSAGHWSSVVEATDEDGNDETIELDPEIKQHIDHLNDALKKVTMPFSGLDFGRVK